MSFKPAMSITFLCAGSDTSRRIQREHVVVENLRWNGYVEIVDLHSDITVSHQHLKTNRYKEIFPIFFSCKQIKARDCLRLCVDKYNFVKDVRAQNFPHTDFVKTLTAGRE